MEKVARILVGLIAAFMLVQGLGFWFRIETMNEFFALSTLNDLGFASIRADLGGFFLAIALFSGYAAWTRNSHFALTAAGLFMIAIAGRAVSLGFDGAVAGAIPPMAFEATAASVLLWARHLWLNELDVLPTGELAANR